MIKVNAISNDKNEICGFRIEGHAGYAKKGKDIVCAAVSMLATNTVNSVEAFTEDKFSSALNKDGILEFVLIEDISEESKLLLSSFFLGIQSVCEEYGERFINLQK